MTYTDRRRLFIGAAAASLLPAAAVHAKARYLPGGGAPAVPLAPTPPMGWNSWNSFATTITEDQALENARVMAKALLPYGYNIFTIDIQWYEPNASSYEYAKDAKLTMDAYGRLLPAPNRFPSAAGGNGFKAIADAVHKLGMKFGIHLMRGIPRQAVAQNTPILGTPYKAQDIANTKSICYWNGDMYGVDMTKPGAQAYYNSVFALYASWGVDFIKMDDMSRPYSENWREIEGAHRAIQSSGRPMMLSLSPGETDLKWGEHVRRYAQMWRISDDFWDDWKLLSAQFQRLENWNGFARPGAWPDADMLPLGRLQLGSRDTKFTPDEQTTLMSLWSIARSPLIMGGDLRHLDDRTLALLTNPEVLAVNQATRDNRPQFADEGTRIWTARPLNGEEWYLALFNTRDTAQTIRFDLSRLDLGDRQVRVRDLWRRKDMPPVTGSVVREVPAHGAHLVKLSV